jgi:polyhydroxyalkanoate synthesis regulator phasin
MTDQMMQQMIENSTKAFTSMFWFQEQGEKFMQTWMEQNKVTRDQAVKMAEKIAEQAKENQKLLQDMVQASVKANFDAYKVASQQTIEQMQKQVEVLTKQVEQLSAKAAK